MSGGPPTLLDELAQSREVRKRMMDRRWEELKQIRWEDVMSLREKMIYVLMLITSCSFATMLVMLWAVVG